MRSPRFVSWALLVALVLASTLTWAQSSMSHEETMVRTAYARLTYAVQLQIVAQDAMNAPGSARHNKALLQTQLKELTPRFEIDDVMSGNLSTIGNEFWENFITKPNGDVIHITASGVVSTFTTPSGITKKSMFYARASWSARVFETSWDGATVARAVSELSVTDGVPNGVVYDHYTSYRVLATLQGRNRSYNAMFLFGKDPKGNESIFKVDHIVGMGALDTVTNQSLYPEVLLETVYRELPEVADWIAANTTSNTTKTRDAYCTPEGCSLPAEWVNKSFTFPINHITRESFPKSHLPQSELGPPLLTRQLHVQLFRPSEV